MLHRLENTIQDYAWGSTDALAELYGVDNGSDRPMAELWMGAHPKAPSRVVVGAEEMGLDEYIARDPAGALGSAARIADDRLPFLFKILCAAAPLSIQVHPSVEQAREGFRREDEAGIDRSAPNRNYRDANHKPELICAIRPFWGLRGFRPVAEIRDELTTVELSEADASIALPDNEDDLARFFTGLLSLAEGERRELIAAAVSLARGRWHGAAGPTPPQPGDPLARYYWVLRIAEEHPGDIGILAPLVMNVFSLRPGQATYQPAGVLHAYLSGVGAELMANSDNVLRGGMTVKHVDADELAKVGLFRSEEPVVLSGEPEEHGGCTEVHYPAPFDEFAFSRLMTGPACSISGDAPQILFCHAGPVRLRTDDQEVELAAGESVFVDAGTGDIAATGAGEIFRARVPG
ncbi:MAG: mannose-6-phosphate isomerase, class I [Spirochaetota bacterium]